MYDSPAVTSMKPATILVLVATLVGITHAKSLHILHCGKMCKSLASKPVEDFYDNVVAAWPEAAKHMYGDPETQECNYDGFTYKNGEHPCSLMSTFCSNRDGQWVDP